MNVRAKFKCDSITITVNNGRSITMTPVYGDTPENKSFWKATPSGEIKLYVVNEAAAVQFEPGKEYYVDFTPAG